MSNATDFGISTSFTVGTLRERSIGVHPKRTQHALSCSQPNWYSHLHDIRPGRHHDRHVARLIIKGDLDPVEAVFPYTGTRRPHEYYW
ncbi:hypothetical protein GOB86_13630 [Acetobacter lambici]|nr:hypothetical protein [Acetobacter lambici]